MRKFTEDELDYIQDRIFNSVYYALFLIVMLIASLYCGVVLFTEL
jgi:hypothetical protein